MALISNYTERPDLLIAEVERHDPGFVKRMNAVAERGAEESRKARFRFGKAQAYTSLGVAAIAAIALLGALLYMIDRGSAGFWSIIGIAAFYAVTQSGTAGFAKMVEACARAVRNLGSKTNKDE